MTDAIYRSVYSSLARAFIHASTFGENALAMRAGLATLEVLERQDLGARSTAMGEHLRDGLRRRLAGSEMVEEVRGLGLLNGIAFKAPGSRRLKALFHGFARIHPGMFGQMLVSRLFRTRRFLTQMCGNNFVVSKVAPPLTVTEAQADAFVEAMSDLVDQIHRGLGFWSEGLAMAPRAMRIA